jgi:thiamine kinase-like enzyme
VTPSPPPAGEADPPPDVVARLDAATSLAPPRQVLPLAGGLTNLNFLVTTARGRYVARLAGETGSLLAIDRQAEYRNSLAAASSGVAPQVVEYVPKARVLVIEWVEGRTYTPADLRESASLTRVARTCRRLHEGPRFVSDFDMFAVQRRYLEIVRERGFRLPARYLEFMPQVDDVRAALAVRAEATVPCNNDLLAANIIDDGRRLWLIDYEYSGNNDACFELGNIWSESDLPLDCLDELVAAYYGRELRSKVARARLLGLMSKYGWTLWASIQDGVSDIDFDFWSWGMEKYDRAVAEFDSPSFERLLDEARRPD